MINLRINIIKEINDSLTKEDLLHRITRYSLRIFINSPFNLSIILEIFKFIFKNNSKLIILINKNIFYRKYINELENGNFRNILKIKYNWADYIILNKYYSSFSSFNLSTNYQYLIDKYQIGKHPIIESIRKEKIDFYIYGPNSVNFPDENYKDSTIIFTKFPNFKFKNFKQTYLFLNTATLRNSNIDILKKTKKFSKVFIPNNENCITNNMKSLDMIPQDNLASPMGLARILYFLKKNNKKSTIKIEGFDLGIYKEAYSGKILSLFKKNNFENDYRISLMQHDFVYNFLLVKDLLYDFDLSDSEEFSKIINLNLEDFFNKIYKVRKFNLLRINLS